MVVGCWLLAGWWLLFSWWLLVGDGLLAFRWSLIVDRFSKIKYPGLDTTWHIETQKLLHAPISSLVSSIYPFSIFYSNLLLIDLMTNDD